MYIISKDGGAGIIELFEMFGKVNKFICFFFRDDIFNKMSEKYSKSKYIKKKKSNKFSYKLRL